MKARTLVPFASGLLFALGLALSGMTRPEKVIGFLDFGGAWDPSLAFVMLGAIAVHFAALRLSRRLRRPFAGGEFEAAAPARVDGRLVFGAVLFGVGWGLAGYCPGPALVSVATGALPALAAVGGMLAGMALYRLSSAPRKRRGETPASVRTRSA